MSLRAAIRANVLLARLDRTSQRQGRMSCRRQRTYFELARQLIHPPAPTLVAVGGLSGTGKSVLAQRPRARCHATAGSRRVAHATSCESSNSGSMKRIGCPRSAYQPEMTAEDLRRPRATRLANSFQGHSVVVDAVFAAESERAAIRDAARRLNIQVCRPLSSDRSCDQAEPRRPARGRCIRRHARDCRTSGKIRYRRGRLGDHRCFRNAGANPETMPNSNHAL